MIFQWLNLSRKKDFTDFFKRKQETNVIFLHKWDKERRLVQMFSMQNCPIILREIELESMMGTFHVICADIGVLQKLPNYSPSEVFKEKPNRNSLINSL